MSSDLDAAVFNTAGLLHHVLETRKCSRAVDYATENPAVRIVGAFLINTALLSSRRAQLTLAETCFILHVWSKSRLRWPTSFAEAREFLAQVHAFVTSRRMKGAVQNMWRQGHLFFGTYQVVRLALGELGIAPESVNGHMVIAASYAAFSDPAGVSTMDALDYYIFENTNVYSIDVAHIFLYARVRVLCAELQHSEYFFLLNR